LGGCLAASLIFERNYGENMKISEKLDWLEEGFIMACFAVMAVVLALQIFTRYVLNLPLIWSEELARYLFVWATFIGAGYGVRKKIHLNMEVFFNMMPRKMKIVITIFTNVVAIFVFAYLIPYGISTVKTQWNIESSAMQIPMSWVYVALPIGCFIVCLRLIGDTVRVIKSKGEKL
jgi:TRAP-type C4-dicarboxylate transport system permease small subunit